MTQTQLYYQSPVGRLLLREADGALAGLCFAGKDGAPAAGQTDAAASPLLQQAVRELDEYFAGRRRHFTLPLAPQGTAFQKAVWQALCAIPYGETRSYQQMATAVGNLRAARAVGMANNRNPLAIVVPCHRVVGTDGRLVGYAGGLATKQYLLALEQGG